MKKRTKYLSWLLAGSMVMSGFTPALPTFAANLPATSSAVAKSVDPSLIQEDGSILLVDLNFDQAEADGSFLGGAAKATGNYSLADHANNGKAVYFNGSNQFLSITKEDGSPIFSGQEEITISYDVKRDRSSGTNWDFFISNSTAAQTYQSEKYLGACVNAGNSNTTIERYFSNNIARPAHATVNFGADWTHLDIEVSKNNTKVYVNGEFKAQASSIAKFSNIAGTRGIFQLGKANWGGGEYTKGWIDNFKVYDNTLKTAIESCTSQLGDLTAVKDSLSLPVSFDNGISVSWESSDASVITSDGTVTRPSNSDKNVTLTATFTKGDVSASKTYSVTVLQIDPENDLAAAKDALHMLSVTGEDLALPAKGILGTSISWKSSDSSVLTDDGHIVKRPDTSAGNTSVTLTATLSLAGKTVTKDFPVEIMEEFYGYIMGYVTGNNDRTGSLHLAYSQDGSNFTALNGNSGIHFAQIDTNDGSKNLSTGVRYTGVYLFRKADGSFGLVAPQGKDQKSVYLYDSKDLLTYENERLLSTNTSLNTSNAECTYDTMIGAYRINWTNNGVKYSNISEDLKTLNPAAAYDYTSASNNVQTLPADAKNYNIIPVTKAEYEKILARFDVVENTGLVAPEGVTVNIAADVEEALPKNITANFSDGSQSAFPVTWDTDEVDFSNADTYTVTGTVNTYTNPLIEERADPQIMWDAENKCYYFTASYPAKGNVNNGYDRIVLRKASSIEGLSDAQNGLEKEVTIWKAPASGKMAKHVWAPELQKINGKWYVFFAAGNSDNIWAIRPYVLVCQGDDPYVASNWVKADGTAEIHAATSKQAAYFQHMSLDMTYFEHNGKHYVIWADIIGQSALYMQEINPDAPWQGTSDKVIMLTTPEFGWERDSERVNEGATILKHDGKIFCAFSASGTGPEYCIGILYADEDADLMDAASWTKMSYPLLTSSDVPGEYGPGHNSFTVDAQGNPVFVYHARSQECYDNQCDWANVDPLYDPCRHARVKNVHWNEEGLPILKMSTEEELPASMRRVSIQVTVQQDSDKKLENAVIELPVEAEATGSQIRPDIKVTYKGQKLTEGIDYTLSYGENTALGTGSVTITAKEGSLFIGSKTATFAIVKAAHAVVHYDMSGTASALKNKASDTLDGTLTAVSDKDFHTYNGTTTLSLNKAGYVSLPSGIVNDNTLTVTVTAATSILNSNQWLWTFGKNNWNYAFFTPVNDKNNTKFTLGQQEPNGSTGAWGNESGMIVPSNAKNGIYQTYAVVINGTETSMYINGTKVADGQNPFDLMSMIPANGTIGYIGKSLYSGDPLFIGQVADFAVYDDALSENQIKNLADQTTFTDYINADIYANLLKDNVSADQIESNLSLPAKVDGVNLTWTTPEEIETNGTIHRPVGEGDKNVSLSVSYNWNGETVSETFALTLKAMDDSEIQEMVDNFTLPYGTAEGTEVYGNITLPSAVGLGTVTWSTDHPEIVTVTDQANTGVYAEDPIPAGVITRPSEDTDVTVTATITLGKLQKTKNFTFTVKAAPKTLKEEDLTDYFFAYFTGESFSNGEQIYFSSSEDGLHWNELNNSTPYLTSALGEKGVRDPFILRSPEGDKFYMIATDLKIYGGNGWTAAQQAGSQALMVWESTDLVNWSEQRMVTVSAQIEAGCTWAPEATYDTATGEYVVYWASKVAADGYSKQRLYYAKTRDFYSFTEPKLFIDNSFSTIDTTILEEDGMYYRYSKNEDNGAKYVFAEKTPTLLHSNAQTINAPKLTSERGVEGPTIFKFNLDDIEANGARYCLLLDNFGSGGYYPMVSNDLNGDFTKYTGNYSLPGNGRAPRHGTPIRITSTEYAKVMDAMAEKATASTIKLGTLPLDGFNPSVTDYTVSLEASDAFPVITATAGLNAKVSIVQATDEAPVATITVSEQGKATVTYTINFDRPVPETVTVTYAAAEGGSIKGTATQTIVKGTDTSRVTAVADEGYIFSGWDDGVATATRSEKDVNEDMTITALFVKDVPPVEYVTVTYVTTEGGSIEGADSQTIEKGDATTEVTAVADEGYIFTGWDDGLSTASRSDENVNETITITALFAKLITVNYAAGEGGSIQGTASQTIAAGTNTKTVTAVADKGYTFIGWDDGVSNAVRSDRKVTDNTTITALFVKNALSVEYVTVTYLASEGGSIEGTPSQTIKKGTTTSEVTAVAKEGYTFTGWDDGISTAARSEKTVNRNVILTALFTKDVPSADYVTVTYTAAEGGSIEGIVSQTIEKGASTTEVTAVADRGYRFTGWSDGNTSATRNETSVNESVNLTAQFEIISIVPEPTPVVPEKITLNVKSSISLGVKEKVTLKATVSPSSAVQNVTWTSSKPSVVSVSATGKITAKKKGTAVITASASNGITAACKITVKAAPKKVSFKVATKTLKKGKTYRIRVKLPKKTASYKLTYKSSKKSVATVSASGIVTAKKKGTATITVKTFNRKKATMKIVVK